MKIFTLCISNEGEVKLTGDLELVQAKQIIESILLQQISQQGYNKGQAEERNKIRQGFKSRRNQAFQQGIIKGKEVKDGQSKIREGSTESSKANLQGSSEETVG